MVATRARLAVAATALMASLAACGTAPPRQPGLAGGEAPGTTDVSAGSAAPGPIRSPGPTSSSSSPGTRATPPRATTAPPSARLHYVFPVVARRVWYHPTHAGYPATDIFADCGSPVLAVADAVVLEVSRVDRLDPAHPDGALKGGLFVSVRGDDGVRYYGSHLSSVAAGVERGVRLRGGQPIGSVGHTGDASNVCHLHFGISPPCRGTGDWWIRRGVVWPAPFLDAWRAGESRSPSGRVAAWHRAHGCPSAPAR